MINQTDVKKIIGADVVVSETMSSAITLWRSMYDNNPPWINSKIKSMGLPQSLSREIAQKVTLELKASITGGVKAAYMQEQLNRVIAALKNEKVEYALSRGTMVIKPFISGDEMGFDFIGVENIAPIAFSASGKMTAAVFADTRKIGKWFYTKLEYHQMLPGKLYWVQNFCFRSTDQNILGVPANFADVPDWAEIVPNTGENGEPVQYIANVTQPLYGFFRYPSLNNIDINSPLGVACFSYGQTPNGGIELFKQADRLYSNLVWEFESGERAIYVDPLAFDKDPATSKPILPDQRLYRTLDRTTDVGGKGNLFDAWTPEFRDASIRNGLNAIMRAIELNCQVAYGTISDPSTVALTATEIESSMQRTYVTVTSCQDALQSACDGLLYAMSVLIDQYRLVPRSSWAAVYDWGDSVLTDKEQKTMRLSQEVGQGITSKLEYRMQTKGEDEETAKKMLALVDAERVAQPTDMFATGA